jgi:hypothetical protein
MTDPFYIINYFSLELNDPAGHFKKILELILELFHVIECGMEFKSLV